MLLFNLLLIPFLISELYTSKCTPVHEQMQNCCPRLHLHHDLCGPFCYSTDYLRQTISNLRRLWWRPTNDINMSHSIPSIRAHLVRCWHFAMQSIWCISVTHRPTHTNSFELHTTSVECLSVNNKIIITLICVNWFWHLLCWCVYVDVSNVKMKSKPNVHAM